MLVNLLLQPDIEESIPIYEANCSIKGSFYFSVEQEMWRPFGYFGVLRRPVVEVVVVVVVVVHWITFNVYGPRLYLYMLAIPLHLPFPLNCCCWWLDKILRYFIKAFHF